MEVLDLVGREIFIETTQQPTNDTWKILLACWSATYKLQGVRTTTERRSILNVDSEYHECFQPGFYYGNLALRILAKGDEARLYWKNGNISASQSNLGTLSVIVHHSHRPLSLLVWRFVDYCVFVCGVFLRCSGSRSRPNLFARAKCRLYRAHRKLISISWIPWVDRVSPLLGMVVKGPPESIKGNYVSQRGHAERLNESGLFIFPLDLVTSAWSTGSTNDLNILELSDYLSKVLSGHIPRWYHHIHLKAGLAVGTHTWLIKYIHHGEHL